MKTHRRSRRRQDMDERVEVDGDRQPGDVETNEQGRKLARANPGKGGNNQSQGQAMKPTAKIMESIKKICDGSEKFYVVHTAGPTSYVVRGESRDAKFKVLIGNVQNCSCMTKQGARSREACIHILFVMIKVLRLPPDDPLAWKSNLADIEIDRILQGKLSKERAAIQRRHDFLRRSSSRQHNDPSGPGTRKEVAPGEVCSICQEDLLPECTLQDEEEKQIESKKLTFCKKGCGNSVHIPCMKIWAEHKTMQGEKVTCPLCRQDWGALALNDLKRDNRKHRAVIRKRRTHHNSSVECSKCKRCPIVGHRYRCLSCTNPSINLCQNCFENRNAHSREEHAFVYKAFVQDSYHPVSRNSNQETPLPLSSLAHELQNRELTTEDYDVLLSLDDNNADRHQTLPEYLVEKMQVINGISSHNIETKCPGCGLDLNHQTLLRSLPCCGTVYHQSCALELVRENAKHLICAIPECQLPLFPGLGKDPDANSQAMKTPESNDGEKPASEHPSIEFSITGTSISNAFKTTPRSTRTRSLELSRKTKMGAAFSVASMRKPKSPPLSLPSLGIRSFTTVSHDNRP